MKACHGGGSGSASYSNSETSSIDTLPSIVSHEGFQSELQHAIGDTEVVDDKSPAAMALKEAFSLELDKVNAFYKAKETDMQVLHARLVQEQSKSVQSGAEWCAKVAQLHDTVELLGDFVTLNQLGFSKILKKCEKKVPQLHMSNFFHERLYTSHFASSVVRVELLTWARLVNTRTHTHTLFSHYGLNALLLELKRSSYVLHPQSGATPRPPRPLPQSSSPTTQRTTCWTWTCSPSERSAAFGSTWPPTDSASRSRCP